MLIMSASKSACASNAVTASTIAYTSRVTSVCGGE